MELFGLTFIMFVGMAIAAIGLLMLIAAAFTTSAAWGISSILLPPLAIAFAITHFSKGRNGFAILMIGVVIFAYGSYDKNRDEGLAQSGINPSVEEFAADPVPEPGAAPATENAATPPVVAPPTATVQDDPRREAPVINVIDLGKYVGRIIRVTTDNGAVRTGELLAVGTDSIQINFKPKGVDTLIEADIKENEIRLIELIE